MGNNRESSMEPHIVNSESWFGGLGVLRNSLGVLSG